MARIHQLSKNLINQIAAGEVIERPVSVVKELVENSIDAGSSKVSIEISNDCRNIRVADNGSGIHPDDILLAFSKHATSKIKSSGDLNAIGTLGFRGEALAAISSVSRLDIFSRERGALSGAKLHLEGGVPGTVEDAGCPEGTSIIVRDLFYNTPARLKFMKQDRAEATAIAGLAAHIALSHPDISFRLIKDGREELHTPGDGKPLSAVYAALGRDFALALVEVHGRDGQLAVDGFVTKPLAGRGTRGMQTFFVNGRFIKSQLLTAAVEEAYANRLMKGKFPGCVLNVTLPADMVDVNVHPAKTVVKFVSDKTVFDAVYHTVTSALDEEGRPPKPAEKPFFQAMTAAEFRARPDTPAPKNTVAVPEGRAIGSAPARTYTPAPAPAPAPIPAAPVLEVRDVAPEPGKPFTAPAPRPGTVYHITPPAAAPEPEPVAAPEPEQQAIEMPDVPVREEAPWRIAGEVLKTYIICEDGDGAVWLIDKHAAHERLRFDALKASHQPLMAQPLLTPETVELEPESYAAVLDNLPLLQEFGFVCEDFGGGTVLIREVPADILAADAAVTLEELARQEFLLTERGMSYRDALDQVLEAHQLSIKPYLELGSAALLCQMVERGLGLSFLPEYIVRDALAAGRVARLNVPDCTVTMRRQLFYHRDKWLTPQMKLFIELVQKG